MNLHHNYTISYFCKNHCLQYCCHYLHGTFLKRKFSYWKTCMTAYWKSKACSAPSHATYKIHTITHQTKNKKLWKLFITEIKTTVVCPATEKHVKKYLHQEVFLVEESGEDYRKLTLPYLSSQSFSVQVSLHFSVVPVPCVSFLYEVYNRTAHDSFGFSGCTTYWRRRPRLIGLFSRIQTPILVLFCCLISSGIKSRWIWGESVLQYLAVNKRPV